jgi:hypothetical protein
LAGALIAVPESIQQRFHGSWKMNSPEKPSRHSTDACIVVGKSYPQCRNRSRIFYIL